MSGLRNYVVGAALLALGVPLSRAESETRPGPSLNVGLFAAVGGGHDDAQLRDVRDKLMATGRFSSVSMFDTATDSMGLRHLELLDAVLVWNDVSSVDNDFLGTALADFVDDGGGLVVGCKGMIGGAPLIGGRFLDEGYFCITRRSSFVTDEELGTIFEPDHPIMAGVTSLAARRRPTTEPVAGTLLAAFADDSPIAAAREFTRARRVDLGFIPTSTDAHPNGWDASTDGAALMANSLEYVRRRDAEVSVGVSPGASDEQPFDTFRGNMFQVDTPQRLTGFEMKLDPSDGFFPVLHWRVYEADELGGPVRAILQHSDTPLVGGAGFYGTDRDCILQPGKFYSIGVEWNGFTMGTFDSPRVSPRSDEPLKMLGGIFPDSGVDVRDEPDQLVPNEIREIPMNLFLTPGYLETTSFGGGSARFSGTDRMRGNVITVDAPRNLYEIELELEPEFDQFVTWYVLESDSPTGTYSVIAEKQNFVASVGRRFYTSGLVDVALQPGKFYAIGAAWEHFEIGYFAEEDTLPSPWSGGTIQGGWSLNDDPPYDQVEGIVLPNLAFNMNLEFGALEPPFGTGDCNCDGTLDGFDIDPFIHALTDPIGYGAAFPDCDVFLADANGDGVVDGFDIDPFVGLLTGN